MELIRFLKARDLWDEFKFDFDLPWDDALAEQVVLEHNSFPFPLLSIAIEYGISDKDEWVYKWDEIENEYIKEGFEE